MTSSASRTLTIVVTGANRGIGRAICTGILERHRSSQIHPSLYQCQEPTTTSISSRPRLNLYATSRQGLDLGLLAEAKQLSTDADVQIHYPRLELSRPDSIKALSRRVATDSERDHGAVDVLINNAGVNLDEQYYQGRDEAREEKRGAAAKEMLDVNYRGTLEMCKTFLPYLAPSGRIVNLSSVACSLKPYSETIQNHFRSPNLTLADVEALAQEYLHAVRTSREQSSGFGAPIRGYAFSKACVTAITRILASQSTSSSPQASSRLINACCPGWIDTTMGALVSARGTRPPKTVEEGARVPLRLALGDIEGVTGKYWANGSVRGKGEGEVQDW